MSFRVPGGRRALITLAIGTILLMMGVTPAHTDDNHVYWIKAKAQDKFERSVIADTGASIEMTAEDYVIVLGSLEQKRVLEKMGVVESSFALSDQPFDFPSKDAEFHNYEETTQALKGLARDHSSIVSLESIGKSHEGRDIWKIRITGHHATANQRPGIVFMGGHHAREHLSMEIPLLFAKHLVSQYVAGDPEVRRLVNGRDIHIIPMVNPDGSEFDIEGGRYKHWRKNRYRNHDGTYGVDLNRNYGYQWGTGGSSKDPRSDTYMGTQPFSEPESRAIRDFVERQTNITILLSFHTFSELILYPWGHTYSPVSDARDQAAYKAMAQTMAGWNRYKPQQSSELYIASGDTTDWSYGVHKIFSFTFELDPKNMWDGGFYPGQAVIPRVLAKNLKPCLYLIDLADNPYRASEPSAFSYGLASPIIQ
jgi:carboxypeptidase T